MNVIVSKQIINVTNIKICCFHSEIKAGQPPYLALRGAPPLVEALSVANYGLYLFKIGDVQQSIRLLQITLEVIKV
jgi:hypothetical protein